MVAIKIILSSSNMFFLVAREKGRKIEYVKAIIVHALLLFQIFVSHAPSLAHYIDLKS